MSDITVTPSVGALSPSVGIDKHANRNVNDNAHEGATVTSATKKVQTSLVKENHAVDTRQEFAGNKINEVTEAVNELSAFVEQTKKQEPEDIVIEINNVMASMQRDINFSVDEESGRKVISVHEKETGDLIRQLPSEDALKLLENLENLKGLLFKANI